MLCAAGFAEANHIPELFRWSLQNSVKQFCPEIQVKTRVIMFSLHSLSMSHMLESPFWIQKQNIGPNQIHTFASFFILLKVTSCIVRSIFLLIPGIERYQSFFSNTVSGITNCWTVYFSFNGRTNEYAGSFCLSVSLALKCRHPWSMIHWLKKNLCSNLVFKILLWREYVGWSHALALHPAKQYTF